jgi:hypothetical protein
MSSGNQPQKKLTDSQKSLQKFMKNYSDDLQTGSGNFSSALDTGCKIGMKKLGFNGPAKSLKDCQ